MKSINNYIQEALIKKDTILSPYKSDSDKFKVDISTSCYLTKKQIGIIIDYFENVDILPKEITNYYKGNEWTNPQFTSQLYVYWDGPDRKAPHLTFKKNSDNKFRVEVTWPDADGSGEIGGTGYPGHKYGGYLYITFDNLMKVFVPKAMKIPVFIDRIKRYQNN